MTDEARGRLIDTDAHALPQRSGRNDMATFVLPPAYTPGWYTPEPTGRWTADLAMLPVNGNAAHTHIRLAVSNHHDRSVVVRLVCGPYSLKLSLDAAEYRIAVLRHPAEIGYVAIIAEPINTVTGDSRSLGIFVHWFEYVVAAGEEVSPGGACRTQWSNSPDSMKSEHSKPVSLSGQSVSVAGDPADPYFAAAQSHADDLDDLVRRVARLPDGAAILDVGANIGLSALAMSLAHPLSRIFAFEPNPTTFGHLRHNVRPFANVEAIQVAASDRAAVLHFHPSPYAAGSHVVGAGHIHAGMPTVDVTALSLDGFVAERGMEPSFIKLDVEGHEPEALAGAAKLIETFRPVIYMEFNSWTLNAYAGHSPAAFARAIWDSFDVEGYPQPLQFLHENLTERRCVSNITMRLKPGAKVPSLDVMSFPPAALERLSA